MLSELKLRTFRCFDALRVELAAANFFIGDNGQGKTSILEAACVLLRLQSQRSATLAPVIKVGQKSFGVSGRYDDHALEFRYSTLRRKLLFDEVEQQTATEYLRIARVVSFANTDIELVRGASEARRRFLDFLGAQTEATYRPTLRAYERALRARNALLKSPQPRPREIAAYDAPLLDHGAKLSQMRARLAEALAPLAAAAHAEISGSNESLQLRFSPGNEVDFAADLARSGAQEQRLRQTIVGPHRDDLTLLVNEMAAAQFASEGQQRTVALALKIAQARAFTAEQGTTPLLLIDDIFGELDPERRNRLLTALPRHAQKLITATTMSWRGEATDGRLFEVGQGKVTSCS
ncbi:MAG TPA: DNA replication and repair protein RecF [Chthoniobacterales bacterium]